MTNAATGNNLGEAISYDVMGNITSLNRDNFGTNSYKGYNGNRLTAISGFTNSSYAYDANGNLTSDSQKNITLGYNFLNLPQTVTGSQNLTYTYNAAGEKLQKQAGGTTTDYIDGIQYTNNSIDIIQTEVGLARRSGNNYSYEYNLSDHLGNVRVTFYKNPKTNLLEVLQRDNYYAFGLRKVASDGTNKYLYNGKELQEELGQYDYDARFYDPVIGRWNVVDPLAEKMRRHSPYNYGFNNPIRFIDSDGMQGKDWVKDKNGSVYWDSKAVSESTTKPDEKYIGKVYEGLTVMRYEEHNSFGFGLVIRMGYNDGEPGYSNPDWVQTVRTNSSIDGSSGSENTFNDPQPADDDTPFYQTRSEHNYQLGRNGQDITFDDRPTRSNDKKQDGLKWEAELSVVERGETSYKLGATVRYGFEVKDGKVKINEIRIQPASDFQKKTLDDYYKTLKQ